MKIRILAVLAALAMVSSSFAADLGADVASDAAYNSGFSNGSNGGTGFNAWSISSGGSAGSFVGSSVGQGFGDIDTAGEALAMWANPAGANFINADRMFAGGALSVGQTFSIDLAIAYRNGNKGLDLDIGGIGVWNFNVGSDLYTVQGGDLGWAYSQTSIFQLDVTQTDANNINVVLTRGGDVFNQSYNVGGQLTGFGLYNAGTDASGDLNNLFVNNLEVVPEPSTMVMALVGVVGIVAARRRMQK